MRKKIQKDGNTSHKIRITSEDMELYNLKIGDVIELTITKVINQQKGDMGMAKTKDSKQPEVQDGGKVKIERNYLKS